MIKPTFYLFIRSLFIYLQNKDTRENDPCLTVDEWSLASIHYSTSALYRLLPTIRTLPLWLLLLYRMNTAPLSVELPPTLSSQEETTARTTEETRLLSEHGIKWQWSRRQHPLRQQSRGSPLDWNLRLIMHVVVVCCLCYLSLYIQHYL